MDEFRHATRRAFDRIVELAVAEHVDFILIAGDLYDGDWRDYNTGLYFIARMHQLKTAGIRVFIIAGNHDAASRITRTLQLPDNVTLFPNDKPATVSMDDLRVAVHGQGFSLPAIRKDLSRHYPAALEGYFNVGLLHTQVSGSTGHEPYAPCTLEGLKTKGYHYWALGHIHRHEVLGRDPHIVYPGNPQGRHVREAGVKGCVLVTVDGDHNLNLSFRPMDVVRWVIAEVDVTGIRDGFELLSRCRRKLAAVQEENEGLPLAVRCLFSGRTDAAQDIMADSERWHNEIRSIVIDTGAGGIWLEQIHYRLQPFSAEPPDLGTGPLAELIHVFTELETDPEAVRPLARVLDDIQKKLPRELRIGPEALELNDPQWLSARLPEVKSLLVNKLRHVGAADENR